MQTNQSKPQTIDAALRQFAKAKFKHHGMPNNENATDPISNFQFQFPISNANFQFQFPMPISNANFQRYNFQFNSNSQKEPAPPR